MFGRVMEYASSHGTQEMSVVLRKDCDISDSFGSTMSFDLKTLELACAAFPSGFGSSSFQMLTTLCLIKCHLRHDEEGVFDLISSFPSLIHLVISECIWVREKLSSYSKIIGPQLLRLELDKVLNPLFVAGTETHT
ncbi:hypothetical protein LINGRAHAP2_LOCUS12533 [Linum grandiflorum]